MDSYFNSIYCVVITMTTVGYGDLVPGTFMGRFIAMVSCVWGTFLMALCIVVVGKIFDLSHN